MSREQKLHRLWKHVEGCDNSPQSQSDDQECYIHYRISYFLTQCSGKYGWQNSYRMLQYQRMWNGSWNHIQPVEQLRKNVYKYNRATHYWFHYPKFLLPRRPMQFGKLAHCSNFGEICGQSSCDGTDMKLNCSSSHIVSQTSWIILLRVWIPIIQYT